jgi:hypothetical protein
MAINLNHQTNKISSSSQVLTVDQNGAIVVPIGTTSGRSQTGVATAGSLRYNSDTSELEHYTTSWRNVVSLPEGTSLQGMIDESAIAFAIALGG